MLTFLCPPSQFHLGVCLRLYWRKLLFANWNALQLRGSREVSPVAWRNFFVAHCYCSLLLFVGWLTSWSRIDFTRFCRVPLQSIGYSDIQKAEGPTGRRESGKSTFSKLLHESRKTVWLYFTGMPNNERAAVVWLDAQCISNAVKIECCPTFNWFLRDWLNVDSINLFYSILGNVLSTRRILFIVVIRQLIIEHLSLSLSLSLFLFLYL